MPEKPLIWLESSRQDVRAFPADARRVAGFQLWNREGKRVMKLKVTRSTGNVFRDLGFSPEEAEHLKVRSNLMIHLQKAIVTRGLKQAEAAKLLGVTQPRVSDLMRGRIDLFSIDTLIHLLARLGIRVGLVVRPSKRRVRVA